MSLSCDLKTKALQLFNRSRGIEAGLHGRNDVYGLGVSVFVTGCIGLNANPGSYLLHFPDSVTENVAIS